VDMASDGGPTLQAQAGIPAIMRAHGSILSPSVRHVPRFAGPRRFVSPNAAGLRER